MHRYIEIHFSRYVSRYYFLVMIFFYVSHRDFRYRATPTEESAPIAPTQSKYMNIKTLHIVNVHSLISYYHSDIWKMISHRKWSHTEASDFWTSGKSFHMFKEDKLLSRSLYVRKDRKKLLRVTIVKPMIMIHFVPPFCAAILCRHNFLY